MTQTGLPNKRFVLVVSGGRTGTQFFGRMLSDLIEDAYSVHEPDILRPSLPDAWQKIRVFGFRHMIIDRLRGRSGIRNLTQRFLSGRLTLDALADEIRRQRGPYYASIPQHLVIESYYQWFGILPAVPLVMPQHKIVGIVRDPRSWVTSWMNIRAHYGSRDTVTRLGFRRLDPEMVGDEPFIARWPSMTPFEKNCWHWKVIYEHITAHAATDERARLFRYEDLFLGPEASAELQSMLAFMTRFEDVQLKYRCDPDVLERRLNASVQRFDPWTRWSPERARSLEDICGPLMRRFGYGTEPEWKEKLR